MTCDQPAVTAEHLQALIAGGEVMASALCGTARGSGVLSGGEYFQR